ncbi:MAG: hypothetical protein DWQ08_03115, partial [Proteobacteria bacterium]
VLPGVYASAIRETITLSKGDESLELGAGRTGFADQPRLTCLDETPEFIRRDPLPAPGDFSALGGACGFSGGGGQGDDIGLSSAWPRMERRFAEEIDRFVKDGYPANSIIMHAVSSGLTIDKTIYLMTRADTDRAEEFFNAAFALQDSLPGWACGSGSGSTRGGPYSPYYGVNDLPPKRTISEVAERYFVNQQIMEPQPNWFAGDFHMLAYTSELVELANEERWYNRSSRPVLDNGTLVKPILVSLYGETEDIVLDIARDDLLALQQQGVERLPVVFYFNKDFQRAVTDIRSDTDLSEVISMFNSEGAELTPVPLIGSGDYHLTTPIDEITELFDIPDRDDIDPIRFTRLTEELARDGFTKRPVVVTLYSEQDSRWVDDPERVRAAIEAGFEEVPVALLYHRLDRLPCGAAPSCVRRVCEALTCAGGAPSACQIDPALERQSEPVVSPPPASVGGNPSDS